MFKKYKIGFDVWGALLFLIIMIPNFIWFSLPAPNDILRVDSVTKHSPLKFAAFISCLLYFASWIFYYCGITDMLVILGLTVPPCLAFLFFALDRKNMIAVIPIVIFSVCHLIYGVVNFII